MDSSTRCRWQVSFRTLTGLTVAYEVTAPAAAGPDMIASEAAAHHARLTPVPIDTSSPGLRFLSHVTDVPLDGAEEVTAPLYWTVIGADWEGCAGYTALTVLPGLIPPARAFIEDRLWANIAHVEAATPEAAKRIATDHNLEATTGTIPERPALFSVKSLDAAA
ncbi:hypothetical protein ABZ829_28025 [Streptomyces xanthochromogenes]|uniref:hypothetical protein n=1 Tax=Streptomyces xanthochromogenes TaxID=67384 RepID=UPI00343683C6